VAVFDWDARHSEDEPCYCFAGGLRESGPMAIHMTVGCPSPTAPALFNPDFAPRKFRSANSPRARRQVQISGKPVRWEYPLRFKARGGIQVAADKAALRLGVSRRASNVEAHAYLNSCWFESLDVGLWAACKAREADECACVRAAEQGQGEAGKMVRDARKVVQFQGYLMKRQARCPAWPPLLADPRRRPCPKSRMDSSRVRRWFVLAPPFLLCYRDSKHAQTDFGRARAVPHEANRAIRLSGVTAVRALAEGDVEFQVETEGKTWTLQAGNKEDLDRWVHTLTAWSKPGGAGSGKA
jgi:hypothetical protein